MEVYAFDKMHTFGDLFTYDYSSVEYWGRRFYGCILLRDFLPSYYKEDMVGIIDIDHLLSNMYLPDYTVKIKIKPFHTHSIIDACKWSYTGLDDVLDKLGLALPRSSYLDSISEVYDAMQKEYWASADLIQTSWKRSISDPAYMMCRNRLMKEFEENGCISTTKA